MIWVINKKRIMNVFIVVVFTLLLINPEGISQISPFMAKAIWTNKYQLFYVPMLILFVFIKRKNISNAPKTIIPIVFIVSVFLITAINGGSLVTVYDNYMKPLCGCLLFFVFSDRLEDLLDGIQIYLGLLIILDLICMIAFPGGMYVTVKTNYSLNWLLGYKSSLQYYLYPFVMIVLLKSAYKGMNVFTVLSLIIAIYASIKSENMMLVACVILVIMLVIFGISNLTFIFNGVTCLVVAIISNLVILFMMEVISFTNWGRRFFELIGKDFTFSGRGNVIWPMALLNISKRPILGYGVLEPDNVRSMLKMPAAIHAHNQILEVLLNGGVVLLIIYGVLLYYVAIELSKNSELKATKVLSICMLGLYLMLTVEVFTRGVSTGIWIMVCCALHPQLVDEHLRINVKSARKLFKIILRRRKTYAIKK